MTHRDKIAVNGRIFCLAAVLGLAFVTRDADAFQAMVAVAVIAALSAYLLYVLPRASLVTLTAECLLVGLITGLAYPHSLVLLPYLAVLPLLAGLGHGWPGIGFTVSAQALVLFALPMATGGLLDASARLSTLAPWLVTNFGAGLVGMWARRIGLAPSNTEADENYESARQLLTQLRTIARRLSDGLDVPAMANQLLLTMHEHLDDHNSALFVSSGGGTLIPLSFRGQDASRLFTDNDPLVERCWLETQPVTDIVAAGQSADRYRTALPLRIGQRMIGVAISASDSPAPANTITALMPEIDSHSLRLDTALVFDEIRTMATTDERQRLAREIHDGIAQEIASLGYVVDNLSAETYDTRMKTGLHQLRNELTRVVADLRLSIFDLRSDVTSSVSLGAALSDYVRQVGAKSSLAVHLSLRESTTRLPPRIESELFRIAQEAVTNARKHAGASNLWVECTTDPPEAALTVRDDGAGLARGRDDSYGMAIMRERASRIGAELDISDASDRNGGHGTQVTVRVAPNTQPTNRSIRHGRPTGARAAGR